MQLLEERIRRDGIVKPGNVLKVDGFLNHQMDVDLFNEMGKELRRLFPSEQINKILTIEYISKEDFIDCYDVLDTILTDTSN